MKKIMALALATISISPAMAASFDGVYSGINIAWARPAIKVTATNPATSNSVNKTFQWSALSVGLQAGYALTTANKLYAAGELNFNYDGFGREKKDWNLSSIAWGNTNTASRKVWHIALAAKGGYNFNMAVAYLGAFVGFASHEFKATFGSTSGTVTRRGLVYGPLLGVDFKVTDRLTAGVEGRMDFGSSKKKDISNRTFKIQPRGYDIRGRVNFSF